MESIYKTAGKGLYYLFIGQILALFGIIPFVGILAVIAGAVLSIYGLYTISQADPSYQNAFILTIVNFVISILSNLFFRSGILNSVFSMLSSVLGFLVVYFICTTTAKLLDGIDTALVNRAALLWKMYLVCTLIMIVCDLLSVIPIINILAGLVGLVTVCVQFAASILYLIFLWKSQRVLQSY